MSLSQPDYSYVAVVARLVRMEGTLLCPCGTEFDSATTRLKDQVVCNRCVSYLLDPDRCSAAPCWQRRGWVA